MCSRWCLLALVACVLVNVVVDGDVNRVVGTRCNPRRKGSWGLWCNVKWECHGPEETKGNMCVDGETAPPPRVVCCPQKGPAPPEEVRGAVEPVTTQRTRLQWNFQVRETTTKKSKEKTTMVAPNLSISTALNDSVIIAKRKCAEYNRYVYIEGSPQVLLPGIEPEIVPQCLMVGQMLIPGRILTDLGEFPHMVALGYEHPGSTDGDIKWLCGGSLISEHFVLTAAHCAQDRSTGMVRWVLLGGTDLQDIGAQRIKVVEALKHPDYKRPSIYDDIALLRLESSPKMSPAVRPACIGNKEPAPNVAPGKFGTSYDATGWGLLNDFERFKRLKNVDLYQVAMEKCDESYQFLNGTQKMKYGVWRDSMMCIGSRVVGNDMCQGDSGGPVQTRVNRTDIFCMYNIDGVKSYAESTCGGEDYIVSIYTRVYHYLPWIVSVVWPEEVLNMMRAPFQV